MPWISGSGGGAGGPTELAYVEFTAQVNITATTEGTAQAVASAGALAFSGATKVRVEFFAPSVIVLASNILFVELFDSTTPLGWLYVAGDVGGSQINYGCSGFREFTPSAATHTYNVKAFNNAAGTQIIKAGSGTSGDYVPGFVRVVTVT